MFCANCGEQLLSGTKFCGACGEKTDAAPQAYEAAPQPPPQPSYSPQQPYVPPVAPVPHAAPAPMQGDTTPMRVSQYIVMLLLLCIPLANLVLLFVWGFGSSVNLNKKNFARASLILAAAGMVLSLLLSAIFGSIFAIFLDSLYY